MRADNWDGGVRPPTSEQLGSAGRATGQQRLDAVRAVTAKVTAGALTVEEARTVLDHLGLLPTSTPDRLTASCPTCGARRGSVCRDGGTELRNVHVSRRIQAAPAVSGG